MKHKNSLLCTVTMHRLECASLEIELRILCAINQLTLYQTILHTNSTAVSGLDHVWA